MALINFDLSGGFFSEFILDKKYQSHTNKGCGYKDYILSRQRIMPNQVRFCLKNYPKKHPGHKNKPGKSHDSRTARYFFAPDQKIY